MQKLISTCPGCQGKLVITSLTCPNCGMELRGQFEGSTTAPGVLTPEDTDFITAFLKHRGNLKQVQEELGMSYQTAKKRLNQVLKALGLYTEEKDVEQRKELDPKLWQVDETSSKASDIIKRKLKEHGGRATVKLYTGTEYDIWVEPDGKRIGSDGLGNVTVEFWIFDVVTDHLNAHGGRAKKGCGRNRLGSKGCGVDTVSGAILQNYYHVPVGGTAFDPAFVVYAIMEWAGIVKNARGELILRVDV